MYPPAPNNPMKLLAAILGALALAAPALAAAPLPDLIVAASFTANWNYQSTETFLDTSCAAQEGVITPGAHKLLRFAFATANVGQANLRLGNPDDISGDWEFFSCHNHWHFLRYAEYRLLDMAGNVVGVGHKQSFCIEDLGIWDPFLAKQGQRAHFSCDHQGLSVGYYDEYDAGLQGQWVEIDNVAAGLYWLELTVNWAGAIEESDYSNNTALVAVTVT